MTFLEVFLSAFGGSILGSLTTYLAQRYLYKKVLDKGLDKIERHAIEFIKRKWGKKDET
jgi:membrane protein DedA with SNARE-associated domain